MKPRSPIVAILGHVDHGKTTLLDYIRKSRLATREHGGITQSIGAYEIESGIKGYDVSHITFIDTPGHEAFTKLRARGANVADIALLIIDAKDSLKPQTVESIAHIKQAGIPYIVVANKIDLPDAQPERVKIDLMKHDVLVEDRGGDVLFMPVSAKSGTGVPELLDAILLIASSHHYTYDESKPTQAFIIETKKDKRGPVISAIIKDGVIRRGQTLYGGELKFQVRALINDLGVQVDEVLPSTPFELLGASTLPEVGTLLTSDAQISGVAKTTNTKKAAFLMSDFLKKKEEEKLLPIVLKTDSQGSLEAIRASVEENPNIEIKLAAVGEITNSDVFLAKTAKAIVIGFRSTPSSDVATLAKQEKVIIKTYNIIYELLDELTEVARILKEREETEKNIKGEAKVAAVFIIEGQKVCGVRVTKGKVNIGDTAQIYRDGKSVGETRLSSLRVRAKVVQEVKKDQEAGMMLDSKLDIQVGDVVKFVL